MTRPIISEERLLNNEGFRRDAASLLMLSVGDFEKLLSAAKSLGTFELSRQATDELAESLESEGRVPGMAAVAAGIYSAAKSIETQEEAEERLHTLASELGLHPFATAHFQALLGPIDEIESGTRYHHTVGFAPTITAAEVRCDLRAVEPNHPEEMPKLVPLLMARLWLDEAVAGQSAFVFQLTPDVAEDLIGALREALATTDKIAATLDRDMLILPSGLRQRD